MQPESGDEAVDEAAYGVAGALALFAEIYGRASYDDAGAPVIATVHYGQDYVNAFWDGTQLVFGDGDRRVFDRFTKPVDVLGHEFSHGVVQHTAGLVYQGQPGALNESMADVFAACLKQRLLAQTPAQADWLIGEGLFLPGVKRAPCATWRRPARRTTTRCSAGTRRSGHMDDYVETTDDNGGVHLNSGIPNRAFQLAATAIGGNTWAGAGRDLVRRPHQRCGRPRDRLRRLRGRDDLRGGRPRRRGRGCLVRGRCVRWGGTASAPAEPAGSTAAGVVAVRRSGGFVGSTVEGQVDLDGPDDDVRRRGA